MPPLFSKESIEPPNDSRAISSSSESPFTIAVNALILLRGGFSLYRADPWGGLRDSSTDEAAFEGKGVKIASNIAAENAALVALQKKSI